MAKLVQVNEDTQKVFDGLIDNLDLEKFNVNIVVLANDNLKQIGKVAKASDVIKALSDKDVVIIVNEEVFDKLDPKDKHMVADSLLTGVAYNSEKDSVVLTKPDFNFHVGIIRKYSPEVCLRVNEIVALAIQQQEDAKKSKKPKGQSNIPE